MFGENDRLVIKRIFTKKFKRMNQPSMPKKWKFALLVWCFIYPAITIISITILPMLVDFPAPLRTLVVSVILVPVMAFFYIPFINKRFFNWLRK
ncbi:hypothetical protein CNR22_05960 [Sphingobacteriaceae bacterium]|nr:hypothetical protein CNR22_05960 [Sphingobacteriaceae bacterium]